MYQDLACRLGSDGEGPLKVSLWLPILRTDGNPVKRKTVPFLGFSSESSGDGGQQWGRQTGVRISLPLLLEEDHIPTKEHTTNPFGQFRFSSCTSSKQLISVEALADKRPPGEFNHNPGPDVLLLLGMGLEDLSRCKVGRRSKKEIQQNQISVILLCFSQKHIPR